MRVGIGLPNTVPGTSLDVLTEWARRADESAVFSSVGVLERIAWDAHEPLGVLEAAAQVTSSIRLATMVVIAPLRDTAELAARAAHLDDSSGGRLVLGLAVGARVEDYEAAGVDHRTRGRRFDEQLPELRSLWRAGEVATGHAHRGGPRLLVGGTSGISFGRMARYADGYVHGGGPPRAFRRAAASARAAWADLERPGAPGLWAQGYFALGDAAAAGRRYMEDYYAFTGPFASRIVEGLLVSPQDVVAFARGYKEAGCDELVLLPAIADPDQVDRLAEVVAGCAADLEIGSEGGSP